MEKFTVKEAKELYEAYAKNHEREYILSEIKKACALGSSEYPIFLPGLDREKILAHIPYFEELGFSCDVHNDIFLIGGWA